MRTVTENIQTEIENEEWLDIIQNKSHQLDYFISLKKIWGLRVIDETENILAKLKNRKTYAPAIFYFDFADCPPIDENATHALYSPVDGEVVNFLEYLEKSEMEKCKTTYDWFTQFLRKNHVHVVVADKNATNDAIFSYRFYRVHPDVKPIRIEIKRKGEIVLDLYLINFEKYVNDSNYTTFKDIKLVTGKMFVAGR